MRARFGRCAVCVGVGGQRHSPLPLSPYAHPLGRWSMKRPEKRKGRTGHVRGKSMGFARGMHALCGLSYLPTRPYRK